MIKNIENLNSKKTTAVNIKKQFTNFNKTNTIKITYILTAFLFSLIFIPSVIAPVWFGSGDDSGLVGHWKFEGDFKDSSGFGNDGTQSGGVKITSGVKGRGAEFDGKDDYK